MKALYSIHQANKSIVKDAKDAAAKALKRAIAAGKHSYGDDDGEMDSMHQGDIDDVSRIVDSMKQGDYRTAGKLYDKLDTAVQDYFPSKFLAVTESSYGYPSSWEKYLGE